MSVFTFLLLSSTMNVSTKINTGVDGTPYPPTTFQSVPPSSPSPPSSGIGSVHFALIVRLGAQNSTAWRMGPCSPTIRTLHKRDTTPHKAVEINGYDPRKHAFDRCDDF